MGLFKGVDALASIMPGISPYSYAFNNPILFNDPSGLVVLPVVTILAQRVLPTTAAQLFGQTALTLATQFLAATALQSATSTLGNCCGGARAQTSNSSNSQQQDPEVKAPVEKKALQGVPYVKPTLQIPKTVPKSPVPIPPPPRPLGTMLMRTLGTGALVLMPHTLNGPEMNWLEQQAAKQHQYEQLSPEEIREVLEQIRTGADDRFAQSVYRWMESTWDTDGSEVHHFIPWNNRYWTDLYKEITDKYGLDLDGDWNKEAISKSYHKGPHPESYHQMILNSLRLIDSEAQGNISKFLDLVEKYIKKRVRSDPSMLRKP